MLDFFDIFSKKEEYPMSAIDNEWGMSLPVSTSVKEEPKMSKVPEGFFETPSIETSSVIAPRNVLADTYLPSVSTTPKGKSSITTPDTGSVLGDYLGGLKAKSQKNMFYGAAIKTASSAAQLFNDVLNYGYARANANLQASNTKASVENQMLALDNQVQYYKNQIADKFNQTMARNTVTMAAKNLRVTAGNLLEQTKDAAYDATKDIEMLESNAELKKIALRSEARQADVVKKLTKNVATANLIGSLANTGLMVATGGGTMESWGDLWSGFKEGSDYLNLAKANKSGSLNDLY